MKKTLALALAVVMSLGLLAGCGGGNNSTGGGSSAGGSQPSGGSSVTASIPDAPEGGGFLVPQVAVDHSAVAHQDIQRTAVVGQMDHPEAGPAVGGRATAVGDLEQVQSAGSPDDGHSSQAVGMEGHGLLEVDPSVSTHDGHRVIAGADPSVASDGGIVQPVREPAVPDGDPEGRIAIGGVEEARSGCAG